MIIVTVMHDEAKRGRALTDSQRDIAERLRAQGFELQRRFELAEYTAFLLSEMLDENSGVSRSLDNTYEAHAFATLRLQLFRVLVVDITACVLDASKGVGSVAAIIKELTTSQKALAAIEAYYADPESLVATVEGGDLSARDIERRRAEAINGNVENSLRTIKKLWSAIKETQAAALENEPAQRMKWARDKLVAHFEKSTNGLIPLDATPPVGNGPMMWLEPVTFLNAVRPIVYNTFCLVTSTTWDDERINIGNFYARTFWDRLKNGKTDLRYRG